MHEKQRAADYASIIINQDNLHHRNGKKGSERLYLPVHVNKAVAYSILHGGVSWVGIHRLCFTAQAQKDERDNGSFLFKTPHHQVQAGHSGDQRPAKGPIVPQPIRLHCHDHHVLIFSIQDDSYHHHIHLPRN